MNNIYCVQTYFHLMISIIKTLKNDQTSDIVLCEDLVFDGTLIENLKQSRVFENIFILRYRMDKKENFLYRIFRKQFIVKKLKNYVKFNFKDYDEIYIFNDNTVIGQLLQAQNLYYNLIEDGTDYYRHLYIDVNRMPFRRKIMKAIGLGFSPFGSYKNIKSIEVNDKSNLSINNKELVEENRLKLFNSLDESCKQIICKIFIKNLKQIDVSNNNKLIFLTQPLFDAGLVSSEQMEIDLYKKALSTYLLDRKLYIKPHPASKIDYAKYFSDAIIFEKKFPIEILNFIDNLHFEIALSIFSTSINNIIFADQKVCLGDEWLENQTK